MDLPGGHGRVQREHLGIITLPDDAGGGADATVRALFQLQSDALKAAQAQADASRAEIGALQAPWRFGAPGVWVRGSVTPCVPREGWQLLRLLRSQREDIQCDVWKPLPHGSVIFGVVGKTNEPSDVIIDDRVE